MERAAKDLVIVLRWKIFYTEPEGILYKGEFFNLCPVLPLFHSQLVTAKFNPG